MASLRPVLDIAVCEKRSSKGRRNAGSSGVAGALKISDVIYAINRFPPRILPGLRATWPLSEIFYARVRCSTEVGNIFPSSTVELKTFLQA